MSKYDNIEISKMNLPARMILSTISIMLIEVGNLSHRLCGKSGYVHLVNKVFIEEQLKIIESLIERIRTIMSMSVEEIEEYYDQYFKVN